MSCAVLILMISACIQPSNDNAKTQLLAVVEAVSELSQRLPCDNPQLKVTPLVLCLRSPSEAVRNRVVELLDRFDEVARGLVADVALLDDTMSLPT